MPMPFPGQFLVALSHNPLPEPTPESFSKSWRDAWLSISDDWGSRDACSEFFDDGLGTLKDLTAQGCNPNFVMSLFSTYLWDSSNLDQERKDPNVQSHLQTLTAIRNTRDFVRRHTWEKTPESEFFAKALQVAEKIAQSYVDDLDFGTGRGLQNDKQNRVIYAIHHHLLKRKVGPRWRLALDLFVAAGAISIGRTRRMKPENIPGDGAQRRIEPRLRSFEKGHPKEARIMRDWVSNWPSKYPPVVSK